MAKITIVSIVFACFCICCLCQDASKGPRSDWTRMQRLYNWTDGIDTWEAPEEQKKNFVSYVAGYSYEGGPVIVTKMGQVHVRKYVDYGNDTLKENLYKRSEQLWYKSAVEPSYDNSSDGGIVLILDMAGMQNSELLSPEASRYYLYGTRIAEAITTRLDAIFLVNLSFPARIWVNLVQPIAGEFLGRAELLGVDKSKISAALRKYVPKNFLPPEYGGVDSFKPLKMF